MLLLVMLFRLLDLIRMAFFLNFGSIWDLAMAGRYDNLQTECCCHSYMRAMRNTIIINHLNLITVFALIYWYSMCMHDDSQHTLVRIPFRNI